MTNPNDSNKQDIDGSPTTGEASSIVKQESGTENTHSTSISKVVNNDLLQPKFGWQVPLKHKFPKTWNPFFKPELAQLIPLIPATLRWVFIVIYRSI